MQHDTLESSNQPGRVGLDAVSQRWTPITLQQFLSLLRQYKVDEKLGRIGMRGARAQHNTIDLNHHRLEINPIYRRAFGLVSLYGVGERNHQRKLSCRGQFDSLVVSPTQRRFLRGEFFEI